jgi:hypothetical protein
MHFILDILGRMRDLERRSSMHFSVIQASLNLMSVTYCRRFIYTEQTF